MESLEIIKKSLLSARSMSIGSSESDGKATASGLMGLLADLLGLFLGAGLLGLFDKGSGRFGLGMVVRQEGGDVVLAATLPLKEGIVVAVAETRAVLEGLVLADRMVVVPVLLGGEPESELGDTDS
ncbi:hypothetical protein ACOSQ3_021648 [Xanthoceras sorbifolium]